MIWWRGFGWELREAACFDTISPVQPFSTRPESSAAQDKSIVAWSKMYAVAEAQPWPLQQRRGTITELNAFVSSLPGKNSNCLALISEALI